jgi:6-pyruvoyl tetrahydropterin synthase/QueD family protein
MTTIYKTLTFDSAHQLEGHEKCGKLHGHTYRIEIWITGKPSGQWNFVLDFHEIKKYFDQFDHSNEVIRVSAETMAQDACNYFYKLPQKIDKVKVRVWETPTAYAEAERV